MHARFTLTRSSDFQLPALDQCQGVCLAAAHLIQTLHDHPWQVLFLACNPRLPEMICPMEFANRSRHKQLFLLYQRCSS